MAFNTIYIYIYENALFQNTTTAKFWKYYMYDILEYNVSNNPKYQIWFLFSIYARFKFFKFSSIHKEQNETFCRRCKSTDIRGCTRE